MTSTGKPSAVSEHPPSPERERALFLSAEPPFPLAGGGPLRSASLLRFLSDRFRVHLVTFQEAGQSGHQFAQPDGVAERTTVVSLPRHSRGRAARIGRNVSRLLRGALPLTDRFCGRDSLDQVSRVVATDLGAQYLGQSRYSVGVIEHFWCAPYIKVLRSRCERLVLDLHNVESALHHSCARSEPWPQNVAHGWFEPRARGMERELLPRFDLVLTASAQDRERVRAIAPKANVTVFPNTLPKAPQPVVEEENIIAFSGNLEYHPNVTAVRYFGREVWPLLRDADPTLRWLLVGKNEWAVRSDTEGDPRIEKTGPVPDAVEELARAKVVVVPLLAGSGTRVKIVEAWAAGRAVVSTTIGAEGLPAEDGENILIADGAESMASAVRSLLEDQDLRRRVGQAGRRTFEQELCWPQAWKTLAAEFERLFSAPPHAAAV